MVIPMIFLDTLGLANQDTIIRNLIGCISHYRCTLLHFEAEPQHFCRIRTHPWHHHLLHLLLYQLWKDEGSDGIRDRIKGRNNVARLANQVHISGMWQLTRAHQSCGSHEFMKYLGSCHFLLDDRDDKVWKNPANEPLSHCPLHRLCGGRKKHLPAPTGQCVYKPFLGHVSSTPTKISLSAPYHPTMITRPTCVQ